MKRKLRRRYGHQTQGEKRTVTGKLTHVYATGGDITIEGDDGKTWRVKLISPRYWATGSSYQAMQAALRVQKNIGRRVTAHIEYHSAFGWTIFGGSNIRLAGK